MNPTARRGALLIAVSALAVSTLAVSGSASADQSARYKPAPSPSTSFADVAPAQASGVIVRTTDGAVSSALRTKTDGLVKAKVVSTRPAVGGASVISFDQAVSGAAAQSVADELEKRSDVISAEPDLIATAAAASPVPRNDPLFKQQYGVWDPRATFTYPVSDTQNVSIKLPKGGYSVRAPYLWRATTGKSTVRVAVIDSGSTVHPDLKGQTTGGYDFFTPAGVNVDRDGSNGRDANPSDPGDWTTVNYCAAPQPGQPDIEKADSSWHSTHVTGIIAAAANNKLGVAGIASGARVEPIRALGPCGGSTSDIADAIVWAAGGSVKGAPKNTKPAKVINLSLGSFSTCGKTYQAAVTKARQLGAVVVAAAGNDSYIDDDGDWLLAPMGAPANCAGVIAVTASDETGELATYSSVGGFTGVKAATVAAPGGESQYTKFSGILSTLNDGTKGPGQPIYKEYDGTSMATPAVAAGAALMSSLGYSRAEIETAIRRAVQPFPTYTYCHTDKIGCGAGILDLSKVPAPFRSPTIKGTMKKGKKLSVVKHWTGSPTSYAYRWYRSGRVISKATKSTYTLTTKDRGKKITVRVYGKKKGFKTLNKLSKARTVAR